MTVENTTIYNDELIGEASGVLTRKYKLLVAMCVILMLLMIVYIGLTISFSSRVIFVPVAGIVIVLLTGTLKVGNYKKALSKRLRVVNHSDEVQCQYTIDEEKIAVSSDNGKNTIYHSDIKKISETASMYLIVYAGNLFILISKKGFANSEETTFRKLLEGHF